MDRSILAGSLLIALVGASVVTPTPAHATDCVVVNTSDTDSASGTTVPGSLRDCMERVGAGDAITFDANIFDLANSTADTTILIDSALPLLDDGSVTIDASNRRVSVNGSGTVDASGLQITSSGNTIRGLTIVAFSRSGIVLSGASNVIGGDRSVGGGPNGQGLRISGNGAFGIEIVGSGTDSNTVKGCWIGLDASGTSAQANVSGGVLMKDGAQGNTIGGENAGDANTVAFNGGTGVEVRATTSRRNSVRGNSIRKNVGGGIKLFDGSNDGVAPPRIQKVVAAPPSGTGTAQLLVSGTTTGAGTVELFNDDGSQGGTFLTGRTYAGGNYAIEVDGDFQGALSNLTATFTDENGNTSPLSVFGVTDDDSDGDLVSDELEELAGTSPSDPLSTPDFASALESSKLGVTLNFAKTNKDSINLKSTVVLPPGLPFDGVTAGVFVAGRSDELVLDAKGKAKSSDGLVSIAMKTSSKTGVTTVQYKVKKSALATDLGPFGLEDRTTDKVGETVLLPVSVTTSSSLGSSVYHHVVTVTYKATQGKSGKASLAK